MIKIILVVVAIMFGMVQNGNCEIGGMYVFGGECFGTQLSTLDVPVGFGIIRGCNGIVTMASFTDNVSKDEWKSFVRNVEFLHKKHFNTKLNWGNFINLRKQK
jgi:hypothetical protein